MSNASKAIEQTRNEGERALGRMTAWLDKGKHKVFKIRSSAPLPVRTRSYRFPTFFAAVFAASAMGGVAMASASSYNDAEASPKQYPNRHAFALNLAGNNYYSTQFPFKNLLRQARPWQVGSGRDWELHEGVDELGNLTAVPGDQEVSTVVMVETWHPEGIFHLEWEGAGYLEPVGPGVVKTVPTGPRSRDVHVQQDLVRLVVRDFDPSDPLRKVRFWLPGVERNEDFPFNPKFVEFLEPFGALRYMNWMKTNHSVQEHWRNRPTIEAQFLSLSGKGGVPIEWMCLLANHLESDPWFCMPHLATDDYVRRFAELAHQLLEDDRVIYLELSNEVWLPNFQQTPDYARLGRETLDLEEGQQPHRAYYAKRASEMFAIWEDVFGGTERLRRVCAAQASTPETARQSLQYGDYAKNFDVLAIAPYFGFHRSETAKFHEAGGISLDATLEGLVEVIEEEVAHRVAEHREIADQYGLSLVAYEAGQHLLDWQRRREPEPSQMTLTFIEANRDPRMKNLYERYFEVFFENGGEMMAVFSSIGHYSRWGSWAIKEYLDQPDAEAPKYEALMEAVKDPTLLEDRGYRQSRE